MEIYEETLPVLNRKVYRMEEQMSINKYFEALNIIEWTRKEIAEMVNNYHDAELQNLLEELNSAYNELTDFEEHDKTAK